MLGKLTSRWLGPFNAINIFPCGVIKIKKNVTIKKTFKVNEHRLKHLYDLRANSGRSELARNPIYGLKSLFLTKDVKERYFLRDNLSFLTLTSFVVIVC